MLRLVMVSSACLVIFNVVLAAPAARVAVVENGILRWQDDGSEVALFGVNYYVPFSIDYRLLKERGLNHEQAIRDDVAHFERLGLTAIRLHCWDREMSDREGNLKDNEHLRLLDLLIAECQKRGIYSVMTPIAWWASPEKGGFSDLYTMPEMTTDLKARAAQCNYLKQYMNHVNRYTGRAYKDDPAIIAVELINEPHYPPGTTDAQITEYVNALVQAVRDTGCRKPIFYNCWQNRAGAAAASSLDGVTFGWYPTGLVAGMMLRSNYLAVVADYPTMRDPRLATKAKIVYEFDAADVHGSYMYPAMARAFRSGGAQIATQFQYEPMCIADGNPNWQTHYLNLIYTPNKATSFAIAAEVFRRVPRLKEFGKYPQSNKFDGFRVSYEEDLSELLAEDAFMYSNDTKTKPPAPEKLVRIVGCGSSPVVEYEGTGAYFLDRIEPGVWKLQVYPDAVMVADPYTGGMNEKVRVLWEAWKMEVCLPDLGKDFQIAQCDKERRAQNASAARNGAFKVTPGEYLLAASAKALPERAPGVEWIAPPASQAPPTAFSDSPARWREGKPCRINIVVAATGCSECKMYFHPGGVPAYKTIPMTRMKAYHYSVQIPAEMMQPGAASYFISVQQGDRPIILPKGAEREFKDFEEKPVELLALVPTEGPPEVRCSGLKGESARATFVPGRDRETTALRLEADGFGPPPSCAGVDVKVQSLPRDPKQYDTLTVIARGGPDTSAVEVSLVQKDGNAFGTNIPLWPTWGETSVPISQLRPMWKTRTQKPDLSQLDHVAIIFGAWLFEDVRERSHAVEIQSVQLTRKPELWTISVAAKDEPLALVEPALRRVKTHGHEAVVSRVRGMDPGKSALRVSVKGFGAQPPPAGLRAGDCTSFRLSISPETSCCREEMAEGRFIVVKARAGQPATNRLEMVLIESDGSPWGAVVPLTEKWQTIKIPVGELRYFAHWRPAAAGRGGVGDHLHPANIEAVNICFGAWLYGEQAGNPHAIEIQEIVLAKE